MLGESQVCRLDESRLCIVLLAECETCLLLWLGLLLLLFTLLGIEFRVSHVPGKHLTKTSIPSLFVFEV